MRKALLHENVGAHQRAGGSIMDTYDTSKKILPSGDYHRGAQLLGILLRMPLHTLAHHFQPKDHVFVIVSSCKCGHRVLRILRPTLPLLLQYCFLGLKPSKWVGMMVVARGSPVHVHGYYMCTTERNRTGESVVMVSTPLVVRAVVA